MFKKKIKCEAFVSNISSIWKVFMVTSSFLIFGSLLTWNIRITIKKITILVKGLTLFYFDIKNVKHTHFRYYLLFLLHLFLNPIFQISKHDFAFPKSNWISCSSSIRIKGGLISEIKNFRFGFILYKM